MKTLWLARANVSSPYLLAAGPFEGSRAALREKEDPHVAHEAHVAGQAHVVYAL